MMEKEEAIQRRGRRSESLSEKGEGKYILSYDLSDHVSMGILDNVILWGLRQPPATSNGIRRQRYQTQATGSMCGDQICVW